MKPLSKKSRTISLIGLFILFIIIVPFLVFYASGYRFSFDDFGFSKTGGIFIHSDLSGTKIFLDEEFVEGNGLVFRNTLIQNLTSETIYKVRVEKDNYLPWYKDLIVYPNLVTEGRVLMIPIKIPFESIEATLSSNLLSTGTTTSSSTKPLPNPEYETIADLFTLSTTTQEGLIFEIETPFNNILPTTTITLGKGTVLLPDYILKLGIPGIETKEMLRDSGRMITWIENGDVNAMWAGNQQSTPFFFCDVRGCRDRILVSLDTDIEYYDFFPNRNDALIVKTGNHIFAVEIDDRSKQNPKTIYEGDLSTNSGQGPEFRLVGNTIFIKDGEELYKAEI